VNSPTILLAELKQQSTTVLMSCRVEERAAQFELFVSAENRLRGVAYSPRHFEPLSNPSMARVVTARERNSTILPALILRNKKIPVSHPFI
jgi:hypothetical protein